MHERTLHERTLHERTLQGDFITRAAMRGAGLPEDCYELSVLRMFRREYVGALEDGEAVLSEYADKAPQITQAIDGLSGEDSRKVWECLYVAGLIPAVLLITAGRWEQAYQLYRSLLHELQEIFLKGNLEGYESASWIDAWVEAKFSEAPVEALEAAARGGVIPLESWRTHCPRLHRTLRIQEEDLRASHA